VPATLKPVLDRLYTTLAALATAIALLYDQAETEPRLQTLEDTKARGAHLRGGSRAT
jgi:hypothetical protein